MVGLKQAHYINLVKSCATLEQGVATTGKDIYIINYRYIHNKSRRHIVDTHIYTQIYLFIYLYNYKHRKTNTRVTHMQK